MMEIAPMQRPPPNSQHTKVRDVWNHACFLVKVAYDLEWAARQFEVLESEAPSRQIKAVLLLNIGMTYALLAEYGRAEKAFRKVLPLHPFTAPLAHFCLGLVRFELTDYEQAQISFKLCACVLDQTNRNRDYRHLGLDFTLSHHLVVENEEIAAYEWTLKQKGRYGYRLLNRLPAPSTFDATVLNGLPDFYCERISRSPTCCSATFSSASSTYSRNVSSIMMTPERQTPRPVPTPTARAPPLNPRRANQQRPMVPRTAQAERPDLSSMAQFLKYTGPDTARAEKTNKPSVPLMSAARQGNAPSMGSRFSMSSEDLVLDPDSSDRTESRVRSSGLLRKFSSITLKKTESIRQLTKNVFSTPLERLGATDTAQGRALGGRVIHRSGPQRRPTIIHTHLPTIQAQRVLSSTTAEGSRGLEVPQQSGERISMDSHMIFSHGGLLM